MPSSNPPPVPSPSKLAHIVLRTTRENYARMVDFYTAFLGGRVNFANDFISFLAYDDEHHRIAIVVREGMVPRGAADVQRPGLEHVAFTFRDMAELVEAYQARKARGMLPVWCVNHGPTMSMYYADPDGNKVETQIDSFETAEEAVAWMLGEQCQKNPIGVDFDPEDLVRRIEAGESQESIMKRPDIGERNTAPPFFMKIST